MLIPSMACLTSGVKASLSRRVNANSQPLEYVGDDVRKLIKKGEC